MKEKRPMVEYYEKQLANTNREIEVLNQYWQRYNNFKQVPKSAFMYVLGRYMHHIEKHKEFDESKLKEEKKKHRRTG